MPKLAGNADDPPRKQVPVDLALQGGGSHGAFTWGVLDRILEEPWLKIEAISGTSAGAMNGAVLVSGYMQAGAEGARAALDAFWGRVADAGRFSPIQRSPLDRLMNRWSLDTSPGYLMMDLMSRVISPYNLNPFGHNPLSDVLEKSVDFAHLGEASIKLFITATNVHTGRGRVFRNKDITPDVLLASACLPTLRWSFSPASSRRSALSSACRCFGSAQTSRAGRFRAARSLPRRGCW
jgi:NTE family protein